MSERLVLFRAFFARNLFEAKRTPSRCVEQSAEEKAYLPSRYETDLKLPTQPRIVSAPSPRSRSS
jgi:hypothetical protein